MIYKRAFQKSLLNKCGCGKYEKRVDPKQADFHGSFDSQQSEITVTFDNQTLERNKENTFFKKFAVKLNILNIKY